MGLPEEVLHKSPFDLSGEQMSVAIAGVLACKSEVLLVLDEPTADDPKGR